MAEGTIISTASVSVWLPWLLLGALLLLGFCCMMQPRYLQGLYSNSLQSFSENSAEQIPSIGAQAGQWLLNIVLTASCAFIVMSVHERGLEARTWGVLLGIVAGIDIFRLIAAMLVTYTFRLTRMVGFAYIRYFSLRSLYTIILLIPILLLYNTQMAETMMWMIIVLTGIFYLLLAIQWSKLFCSSPLDILFVIIYIATVEILPTALLYYLI